MFLEWHSKFLISASTLRICLCTPISAYNVSLIPFCWKHLEVCVVGGGGWRGAKSLLRDGGEEGRKGGKGSQRVTQMCISCLLLMHASLVHL